MEALRNKDEMEKRGRRKIDNVERTNASLLPSYHYRTLSTTAHSPRPRAEPPRRLRQQRPC